MVLTLSTFNCRGIQDPYKRKKISIILDLLGVILYFCRKHTLQLQRRLIGKHNGVPMLGLIVMPQIAEGLPS